MTARHAASFGERQNQVDEHYEAQGKEDELAEPESRHVPCRADRSDKMF